MPVGHQHLLGVGEAGLLGQGATRTVRRSRRPWPRSTVTLGGGNACSGSWLIAATSPGWFSLATNR
jgi:hypothetical protein